MQDEVKVTQAAINQNASMRQTLAEIGNKVSDLARSMRIEQANEDGSWPDICGRLDKLIEAARHQAERETLARIEWRDIESAPKDRYFLACVTPERSEEKLLKAIFGDDHQIPDNRGIIVARWRPKQRKGRVFMSVTGAPFWATHWMELPDVPSFKEKDFPRDY